MHARCFNRAATGPSWKILMNRADDNVIVAIIANKTRASFAVDPSAVDHSTTPAVHTRRMSKIIYGYSVTGQCASV